MIQYEHTEYQNKFFYALIIKVMIFFLLICFVPYFQMHSNTKCLRNMRYIEFTEDLTSNQNQKIKKEKHLNIKKTFLKIS